MTKKYLATKEDLSATNTQVSNLQTAVQDPVGGIEARVTKNENDITQVNSTIGADDTSGLRLRVKDNESAIGDENSGLTKGQNDLVSVVGADNTQGLQKRVVDLETTVSAESTGLVDKVAGIDLKTALGSYYTDSNSDTWTTIIDHPDFLIQARSPVTGNRVVLITNKTGSEVAYSWQASRNDFTEVRGDTIRADDATFEIVGTDDADGKRFIRIAAIKNTLATNKGKDTWWFDIISHRISTTGYRIYVKMLKA